MMTLRICIFTFLLAIAFASCRKPYNPPPVKSTSGYLVVEGVINVGADSTTIKLSRTVNLSNNNVVNPETGAAVTVESNQGATYSLAEISPGHYAVPALNLSVANQYRLRIKTANNETYLSDFVPVVITPPIDSIGFNIVNNPVAGIQIYANTHDATGNAKYFRWDYDETWAFHSKYVSYWISNGSTLVQRLQDQDISTCFTNDVSSDIVISSTAKLKQDILSQAPIAFIPSTSEKIGTRYSILLHQYSITGDAYNFWTSLKTNTEQLGSIFDAQPSQLQTNIHNLNNGNPAIGYVSACTVTSKRVNISNSQLPAWIPTYPYQCEEDTVRTYTFEFYNNLVYPPITLIATGPPPLPRGAIPDKLGYSTPICVDCTLRGTTTIPPFFQ
jgi:hypothetical protein